MCVLNGENKKPIELTQQISRPANELTERRRDGRTVQECLQARRGIRKDERLQQKDFETIKKRQLRNKNNTNDLTHHILPNSATMVGICIMVIQYRQKMPPDVVNFYRQGLAIDSVLFMVSALLSFIDSLERSTLR